MDELSRFIIENDWQTIANQYNPKKLAKTLTFKEGRLLAYKMLLNEEGDDNLRDYATELLNEVRLAHFKEWSLDWKNDVFLGDACYITMKYDDRYKSYKRAFEKASFPPPSLLISLASCYLSPSPLLSLDEAENLAKKALEKELSIEGVTLIRGIYAEKKDQAKFNYWDKIFNEVEKVYIIPYPRCMARFLR